VRQRCIGRLRVILAALIILNGDGGVAVSEEARQAAGMSAWAPRDHVRAFYSGHSLSEGVPEVVEQIARSLGHRLNFEVQVLGYSLLRQRTKGEVPSASEWSGYRAGQNRGSAGLNVADELRQPRRLAPGDKYDVLVVTERHDLPAIARNLDAVVLRFKVVLQPAQQRGIVFDNEDGSAAHLRPSPFLSLPIPPL